MLNLKKYNYLVLVVICLACSNAFRAQEPTTLRVEATDQNSEIVQQLSVQLKSERGEIIREIKTEKSQAVVFSSIKAGGYILEAQSNGFKPYVQKISVKEGKNFLNIKLEIAEIKVNVEVDKNSQTDAVNNAFLEDFTEEQIKALPEEPGEIRKELQRRYGDDIVIRINGFAGGPMPAREQIAAIKVIKSSFDAEFHAIGQTIVDIQTKAGVKKFWASLSLNFGNYKFNARNAFAEKRLPAQTLSNMGYFIFPAMNKKTQLMFDYFLMNSYRTNNIIARIPGEPIVTGVRSASKTFQPALRLIRNINDRHTLSATYYLSKTDNFNFGAGGLNLPERGYSTESTEHRLQSPSTERLKKGLISFVSSMLIRAAEIFR